MADLAISDRLAEMEKRSEHLEKLVLDLQEELKTARVNRDTLCRDLPCFQPYKRPGGRVLLSSVISETDQWYKSVLLIPHEPLRRDMIEVGYLLRDHIKPEEPWKLVNLFHWFNRRFLLIVHAHHDGEEQLFFPAMKKRVDIPDKTAADHKMLLKLLDDVTAIGKMFFENGGNATNIEASMQTLPLLRAKWEELIAMMNPHLAEEEEQMVTFIKDKFSKKEFDALIQKIIKHEGIGGARLFLPSIVESLEMWGTEQDRQEFRKELPGPISFFLRKFWIGAYQKYHRGVLNSLRAGSPMVVIQEKKGLFF